MPSSPPLPLLPPLVPGIASYSPPPSKPPPSPPPLGFEVTTVLTVRDPGSVEPAGFGAAVMASLQGQIDDAPADSVGSSYTVMLNEQTAMVVDQGSYQLVNPSTGAPNTYIVQAFNKRVQEAACLGLVGTCVATLPSIGRRRHLQSSNASNTVDVAVTREYDFAASNTTVAVADLVQNEGGMGVTASQTTGLSATTIVNVLGDAGSSPLADAIGEQGLGMALASQMPTLVVDIVSGKTTPPAAPPTLPPPPPLSPPLGPQPLAPPSSPPASTVSATVVALASICGALAGCLLLILLVILRRVYTPGAKTAMTAVVPGSRQGSDGSASASSSGWPAWLRGKQAPRGAVAEAGTGTSPPGSRGSTPLRALGRLLPRQRIMLADGTVAEIVAAADPSATQSQMRPQSRDAWLDNQAQPAPAVRHPLQSAPDWHVRAHRMAPGGGADLLVADVSAPHEVQDNTRLPTPQRILSPGAPMVSIHQAALQQAAAQAESARDLVSQARSYAETKRAALEAAQLRLRSIDASRRTRAPVLASRMVTAARPAPRMDQILPPARNAPGADEV